MAKSRPVPPSTLRDSLRLFRKTSSAQFAKTFSTYRSKIRRHQAASTLAVGIVGGIGLLLQIHPRFVFILCPLDELQPPSRYFRSVLSSLELRCDNMENGCTAVVKLSELKKHMDICPYVTGHAHPPRVQQTVSAVDQAPELTLSDVISRSNLPLNRLEDVAFGVMFRRKSAELETAVGVPVHTGVRPANISETPMASVGSSTASRWTLARRANVIQQIEKHIAAAKYGDSAAQHSFVLV